MAKFCKYCGKEIPENESCTCELAVAAAQVSDIAAEEAPAEVTAPEVTAPAEVTPEVVAPEVVAPEALPNAEPQETAQASNHYEGIGDAQQTEAAPKAPSKLATALHNITPFFKSYIKDPVGTAKAAVVHKDIAMAAIMVGLQALVFGLFLFIAASRTISLVMDTVGIVSDIYGSMLGLPQYSVPFFTILIYGIICCVIVFAVTALLAFAVAKIAKSDATVMDAFIAAGVHVVLPTALMLLANVFLFVSVKVAIALMFLALLAWLLITIVTIHTLVGDKLNGIVYGCTVLCAAAMIFIGAIMFTRVGIKGYNKIKVDGQTIEDYAGDIGSKIGEAIKELEQGLGGYYF